MNWTNDAGGTRTLEPNTTAPIVMGGMFADRYAIEARLGEGAHAAVFSALDMGATPPQRVALKIARTDTFGKANLEREVAAIARIHGNGIVTRIVRLVESEVQSFGCVFYLVLEHIDGPSLREYAAGNLLRDVDVCRMGAAIARALSAVHDAGFVFADVKPDNIVLRHRTEPVLVDFGAAHKLDELDEPRLLTPAYAAPEQRAGGAPLPASDVYALAVVLQEIAPHSQSRHLRSFLASCMAAEPAARPTASALAQSLDHARVSYTRTNAWKRSFTFVVSFIALAAFFAFVLWRGNAEPRSGQTLPITKPSISMVSARNATAPTYIALGQTHVVWGDGDGRTIHRVSLDGGEPEVVTRLDKQVQQMATAAGILYIRSGDALWAFADGNLTRLAESTGRGGIAADDLGVVWTNESTGDVLKLDPRGTTPLRSLVSGQARPYAISLDATHVYWANEEDGTLARVPRDGGTVEVLVRGQLWPVGTALDETHLYWLDRTAGAILRVPKQGGTPVILAKVSVGSFATALSDTHVYWTSTEDGRVLRVPKNGGTPEVLATGQRRPFDVVVQRNAVYFSANDDNGGVMRLVVP